MTESLFANLTLYSYPFFIGVAWGGAFLYLKLQSKSFYRFNFLCLLLSIFILAWVGGKLFYLAFTAQDANYFMGQSSFWFGGGFVFYGGLLGGIVPVLMAQIFAPKMFPELQHFPAAMALGHSIGRIGCAVTGCCYGKWIELPFQIAMKFPTQLSESAGLFFIFFFLKRNVHKDWKYLWASYFVLYGVLRFCVEFFRGDVQRGIVFNGLMSPGQAISLLLIMIGGLLGIKNYRNFS